MGSIVETEPFQNPRRMLLHARCASRRLLRSGEIQQIAFLPSRGERVKGVGKAFVLIHTYLKFLGHIELRDGFLLYLGAGLLQRDGLLDVGLYCRFLSFDIGKRSEPDLPRRLYILGLLNEDSLGILEQSALHEKQSAVILEAMDQDHVAGIEIV